MTRYADPQRCPDCRAALTPGAAACAVCALSLRGETAAALYGALVQADALLAQLRAASAPTVATGPTESPVAPAPARQPYPAPAARPAARRGLSAASVPRILLALGAGCLLVAALVFLAVTWSVMGVGGRTATLVGFTAVAGVLTGWMSRRGLRAAAESLGLVGYGLLVLDVLGADHAGWFGDLGWVGLLSLLGAVLAGTGVAGALATRHPHGNGLIGAQVVSAVGIGLAVVALDQAAWLPVSWSLTAATLLGVTALALAHLLRLEVSTAGAALVSVLAWLALTVYAVARVADHSSSWHELWLGAHAVPLLAAAAFAAGPVVLRRLPAAPRVAALAVAHLLVAAALLAPVAHLGSTEVTLVLLGVLVATGAATWLLPRPWGLVNLLTQGLAGLAVLVVGGTLGAASLERLAHTADPVWAGGVGDLLPLASPVPDAPAPWLLPLCLAGLLLVPWSLAAASRVVDRVATPLADLRAAAALLAAALIATVSLYPVPVWLVVGALLVVAGCFAAWWLATDRLVPLALAGGFAAVAVAVALHADALSAAALTVALGLAGLVQLRARDGEVAAVGGALLGATLAGAVWSWGSVADGAPVWVALTGLALLGATVLAAPYAPTAWWVSRPAAVARTGLEVGAAATALPLALAGLALAPQGEDASWAAVYLTAGGVVATVMSLLRTDRRHIGWLGGGLLAAASWVRLWDVGVHAPEAYTLPSAAALLVVGVVRLRREPAVGTMTALSPGLSLALVPSLLWAWADPTGPRPLLLGLGCLALVLAGVALRWTAPLVLAAGVGALLVLRLAAPYVGDAVPRWVLIGAAGALLVGVGATWERRLTEARQLVGYVRALR